MGGIFRFDGQLVERVGGYGPGPQTLPPFAQPPDRGFLAGRAILERRAIQTPDALEDLEYHPLGLTFGGADGRGWDRAAGPFAFLPAETYRSPTHPQPSAARNSTLP